MNKNIDFIYLCIFSEGKMFEIYVTSESWIIIGKGWLYFVVNIVALLIKWPFMSFNLSTRKKKYMYNENDFCSRKFHRKKKKTKRKKTYVVFSFKPNDEPKNMQEVEQNACNWIIYNKMHLLFNMIITFE